MLKLTGMRVYKQEVEIEVSAYEAIQKIRKEWILKTSPGVLADYINEQGIWVGELGPDQLTEYRPATKEELLIDKALKLLISQFEPLIN